MTIPLLPPHRNIIETARAITPPGMTFVQCGPGSCAWIPNGPLPKITLSLPTKTKESEVMKKPLDESQQYYTREPLGELVTELTRIGFDQATGSWQPDQNGTAWGAFDSDAGWLLAPTHLQ